MNGKPIAFLGQTGDFAGSPLAPLKRAFELTGLNTGNIAFFHAVSSHIQSPKTVVPWFFSPETVNEQCSALVMPAANMINSFQNHEKLADLFSRLKVPVAVVGLGAQMSLGASAATLEVKDGTKRFIRVLADIGAFVGCRGETTQKVLAAHGLNATVIGCPSNFTNPRSDLGATIASTFAPPSRGIFAHCDYNARLRPMNEKLVKWVDRYGGMISIQDPERGFKLAMRDPETLADEATHKEIEVIFGVPQEEAVRFAINKLIAFADWSSWSFYSRSFSLSLGTRMHGNMLAFQAEIPTILFPHDSRVDELASTMGLPRIPLAKALKADAVEDLFEMVEFDGKGYDEGRRELASRYFGILRSAGVQIAPAFGALAANAPPAQTPVAKSG